MLNRAICDIRLNMIAISQFMCIREHMFSFGTTSIEYKTDFLNQMSVL